MHSMTTWLRARLATCHDERGAALVEYVLLVALIAVVCFAAVVFLGSSLSDEYTRVGSELP